MITLVVSVFKSNCSQTSTPAVAPFVDHEDCCLGWDDSVHRRQVEGQLDPEYVLAALQHKKRAHLYFRCGLE